MSPDLPRGWFADINDDRGVAHPAPWQPSIQVDGAVLPLPVWFDTRKECEQFIREQIVGGGWMEGPDRYRCPDCEAGPGQRCVNLSTGIGRLTFHADRERFRFGGWPA